MKHYVIVGGGAAGLFSAVLLKERGAKVTLLERGERVGRKLSASGNGQGNVTNLSMGKEHYFSDDVEKVGRILNKFGARELISALEELGGIFLPDERGRVYPASRQASAICDLLRRACEGSVQTVLGANVKKIQYFHDFCLEWEGGQVHADGVLLAAGGKAAPSFGTDGQAYLLAQSFGHSLTPLRPVLVQLKCDPSRVRALKGIRVDAKCRVLRGGKCIAERKGDVLFTESGVSGDASFFLSSYAREGDTLEIDFLPEATDEKLLSVLKDASTGSLLCVVNNGLARFLCAQAAGDREKLFSLLRHFSLPVTGTLGFAYAQATRGGIPLKETDENLMSVYRKGLYFAGEILNVDGECGGYNLQWAFSSAKAACEGMLS